jgi:hypothetical protein
VQAVDHADTAGSGTRLFPDGFDTTLALVETSAFESGIVLLRYRPAK